MAESEQEAYKRDPWVPLLVNYPNSKKINAVGFEAETLYCRLLTGSDDGANYDGDPTLIMCKLFAERKKNRQVSERKITKWLQELTKVELISRYQVNSNDYIHIINCKKFKRSDVKEDIRFPACSPENVVLEEQNRAGVEPNTSRTRAKHETQDNIILDENILYCPNSPDTGRRISFNLAKLLLDCIEERKPDFKEPNLQTWAKHINQMIRLDKRDPTKIKAVIEWCQKDSFWQNNILSTEKLRKQFDRLEMQKDAGKHRSGSGRRNLKETTASAHGDNIDT